MNPRNWWMGARAAMEAPAWIAADRLGELLTLPAQAPSVPHPEPDEALRAARRLLRVLSRLPGDRWRTSCLYESVAECLVLRRSGVPAAVCIGVKREGVDARGHTASGNTARGLTAHAWVARNESDRTFHGLATLATLSELKAQR